tara:strand:- start:717 stop:851 length:135 start_codon:yes stop_codon:yes gene_type:complete
VKAKNKDAATPLHWAVFFLQKKLDIIEAIIEILLDNGCLSVSEL